MTHPHVLAIAGWVSVFALSWLLILERVDGVLPFSFLVFFFAIAIFVSAVARKPE